MHPHYPKLHYSLGVTLCGKHDYDAAVAHFNEAVRLKPDYAEAMRRYAKYDHRPLARRIAAHQAS